MIYTGAAFASGFIDDRSYNERNELTGSLRFNNGTPGNQSNPVPAQDRGYVYDPIGNRKTYDEGTITTLNYCANNLNQYTFTDDATTCPPQQGTETEKFLYDLDGNLTLSNNIGTIAPGTPPRPVVYSWDAENRLISVTPSSLTNEDVKVEFKYDYMGRRVQKSAYEWDSTLNGGAGGWKPPVVTRFMWYNWLMIAEFQSGAAGGTGDPAVTKRHVWGLDLAGQSGSINSMEQAGGIGGLLSVYDYNLIATDLKYVYCLDANGNVTQMLDPAASTVSNAMVARYEYDVYGNVTTENGNYAIENRWRFSTKTFDAETGLGYWGAREFDVARGRWLSRDPIDEIGYALGQSSVLNAASQYYPIWRSLNTFEFVRNRSSQLVDPFGLADCDKCGSEVGDSLDRTLLKLSVKMNALGFWDMWNLCEYYSRHPSDGWDISDFHDVGRCDKSALQKFSGGGKCGTGKCAGTVSYHGRCFLAAELNYLLWGQLNKTCAAYLNVHYERSRRLGGDGLDFTLEKALWDVWIFRLQNRVLPCSPCGSRNHGTAQREAATKAGWHRDNSYLVPEKGMSPINRLARLTPPPTATPILAARA